MMNKFYALIENEAALEKKPMLEGRNILMILAPKA